MSTKYKHSHEVPTAVLAKRLDELSDAVGKRGEERDRELTRRVPAEMDRDADLVLLEASTRLLKLEAEREALRVSWADASQEAEQWKAAHDEVAHREQALAAHVERINSAGHALYYELEEWSLTEGDLESVAAMKLWRLASAETPTTSLAHLKAKWLREGFMAGAEHDYRWSMEGGYIDEAEEAFVKFMSRRQAKEPTE